MADTKPTLGTPHTDGCKEPGFRYGATIRKNKDTIAAGTAGKVVMLCKNAHCRGTRII